MFRQTDCRCSALAALFRQHPQPYRARGDHRQLRHGQNAIENGQEDDNDDFGQHGKSMELARSHLAVLRLRVNAFAAGRMRMEP